MSAANRFANPCAHTKSGSHFHAHRILLSCSHFFFWDGFDQPRWSQARQFSSPPATASRSPSPLCSPSVSVGAPQPSLRWPAARRTAAWDNVRCRCSGGSSDSEELPSRSCGFSVTRDGERTGRRPGCQRRPGVSTARFQGPATIPAARGRIWSALSRRPRRSPCPRSHQEGLPIPSTIARHCQVFLHGDSYPICPCRH